MPSPRLEKRHMQPPGLGKEEMPPPIWSPQQPPSPPLQLPAPLPSVAAAPPYGCRRR
jgi:hypothetical protein